MLFKMISAFQLLFLLLLLEQGMPQIAAANLPQMKNPQQSSQQQQQQQAHPIVHQQSTQQHQPQQQHQQIQQQQQQPPQHLQQAQFVHEKDPMQEIIKNGLNSDEDLNDPYQILNEFKHESRLPPMQYPWNPYSTQHYAAAAPPQMPQVPPAMSTHPLNPFESLSSLHTPKFLPFVGYPQPVFIPYPLYIAPEMFYPAFAGTSNDIEDNMSRAANGRRPSSTSGNLPYQRNSPIYYVRLPPSPYMFLPNLGYSPSAPSNTFGSGFSSMLPYQSMPAFSAFSSIYNLPVNFLANGKPTNIYQMGGSPNDIQSSNPLHYPDMNGGFGSRPPPPNPYRPTGSSSNYLSQPSYGISSPPAPQQDSKMTSLKRPFIFNGRPEEIYILPNNFNSLYSDSGYY